MITTKKCCFDGCSLFEISYSRYNKRHIQNLKNVIQEVVVELVDEGYEHFLCGFDRGPDLYFAAAVVEMKDRHPGIVLESVIPYEDQASQWYEDDRELYYDLLACCDKETMLQHHYTENCFMKRSQYMVSHTDMLVTVFDGKLSPTMKTVQCAQRQGKRIMRVDPVTLLITDNYPYRDSLASF